MTDSDITSLIRNTELFGGLDERIISAVRNFGRIKELNERDVLFMEGFRGDHFYLLLEGSVKVVKTGYDGRESIIRFIQPGEVFAEAIILGQTEYPAGAIALSPSRVLEINRLDFLRLFDHESLREEFIKSLIRKLFYLTSRVHYLSSFDVEERFFKFLLERFGQHESYEITIAKRDIATAIGTVPETLSRLISRLKNQGDILEWEGSRVTLRKGFWQDTDYNK
jgi:CRP/FNR family transcriptional regulator, dissimilatory nitrate respiration regulator